MTDLLSALLHDEVDHLAIPVPPVHEALAAGRRVRRRRRLTQVVAVAAVVGVVGAGVAAVTGGPDDPRGSDGVVADTAPTGKPVDLGPVFASGKTLYLDKGATRIEMNEVIQAIYFTSAGLLLRTNETGASDGGAPFHFSLVTDNGSGGSVEQLDLTLGEVVPATDPRQPYVAYAESGDQSIEVVVLDVTTGEEVGRVAVDGLTDWGGWEAPPVALAGDTVYVADFEHAMAVDWRTGASAPAEQVGPGIPVVAAGRTMTSDDEALHVVDLATGGDVLTIPNDAKQAPWATLSPDGGHVIVSDQMARRGFEVYDVHTGSHVVMDGQAWSYGWTAAGELYGVDNSGVRECETDTGQCTTTPLADGTSLGDLVVLGGKTYES